MDKKLAEETSLMALKMSSTLDKHLRKIMDKCSKEDFEKMRSGVGYVMGYLYTDIMEPIWHMYPELRPTEMGGKCDVPRQIYEGYE
jgi:hypothetical protein